MSDPTRVSETLSGVHRLATPQFKAHGRHTAERYWSCNRCEGRGVVRETVTMQLGENARIYQSVARCRCPAGERQSPTIALCSDAFWYGIGVAIERVPPAEPDYDAPPPPEPEPAAPATTLWTGTVAEELDP